MSSHENNVDAIRQRMDLLRRSLQDDVADVATSVRTKSDWRYYVQTYPWLTAAAATTVGYLLVPGREKRVEQVVPKADALEEIAKQEKLVLTPEPEATQPKGVAASLMAFALAATSRAAMGYLSNKLGAVMERATNPESSQDPQPDFARAEKRPK